MSERRAALEAAIDEDPDDPRGYSVFADWLQEQGDPRGELIALQQAAESDRSLAAAARECFEKQVDRFGSFTTCEFTWRHGFVRRATLGVSSSESANFVRTLLDHPSGRFIVDLSLWESAPSSSILGLTIDALVEQPRSALRSLSVVARSTELSVIARLLEHAFPRLTRLGILGAPFADDLVVLLCGSPLVRQLRELDLAGGMLTDRGVTRLAQNADALAHLDLLDLRLNKLTQNGARAATRLAKTVNVTGQHTMTQR
jgi:uncharacterized protein (TIGR02996 family)